MASKRKPYIRVARSILNEPWDDRLKLTLLRLMGHMADRWATDRLSAVEATQVTLSPQDLCKISASSHPGYALKSLRTLQDVVSLKVEILPRSATRSRGLWVQVNWPKLAEYQGWFDREFADDGPDETRDSDDPPTRGSGQSAPSPSPEVKSSLSHSALPSILDVNSEGGEQPQWVSVPLLLESIKDLPGTPEAKSAWIAENLGLMGLEVLKDPRLKRDANRAAALAAIAYRYYRAHCQKADTPKAGGPAGRSAGPPLRSGYESATERAERAADEWLDKVKAGGR